jgi:hypothetical protein
MVFYFKKASKKNTDSNILLFGLFLIVNSIFFLDAEWVLLLTLIFLFSYLGFFLLSLIQSTLDEQREQRLKNLASLLAEIKANNINAIKVLSSITDSLSSFLKDLFSFKQANSLILRCSEFPRSKNHMVDLIVDSIELNLAFQEENSTLIDKQNFSES